MSNKYHHSTRFSDAASAGFRVFPCKAQDKRPAVAWSYYQGHTASAEQLAEWDASDLNVGIVTGAPSNLIILDVDSEEAQQLVDGLDLPPTPTVQTGKGRHYYFRRPGVEVRNSVRIAGVKLDVRGDGGYVIGAGSVHPSGAIYEWLVSPADVEFASFPPQLAELLTKEGPRAEAPISADRHELGRTGTPGLDRYLADQLAEAQTKIEGSKEGERNDTLFKMAARIAGHIAAASSDWGAAAELLAASARTISLDEDEISRTLASGWRSGSSLPTPWIRVAMEHVYLAFQERFYHLPSGTDLKPTGFNGQFGHLYFGKGTFANYLLGADCVRKVHDLTYDPLSRDIFLDRDRLTWLNTYRPSKIEATSGDATPFTEFLEGLVPDEDERNHLLKMMAFTVRNPGQKLRYALIMRSAVQGVGKSMLIDIWSELLGPRNVRKTTSKEIAGDFQGYLPQTLMIVCEELNLGVGLRAYNDLKDMVTADTAAVNEKHMRPRIWPLFATFVFLSNLEAPMFIEKDDRRIFYIDSPAMKRDPDFYAKFASWWRSNLGIVRHFLDGIDLGQFNPFKAPPMTAAKLKLIEMSKSELAQELAMAIEERRGCFNRDVVTLEQITFELRSTLFGKTRMNLVKALKEVGAINLGQQRVGLEARASLWVIRNPSYWPHTDPSWRTEELDREAGIFAELNAAGIEVAHISQYPAVAGVDGS